MSDPTQYHVYRLDDAYPGVLGECLAFVTVTKEVAGWWGTYHLLSSARGISLSRGDVECAASMISSLQIADPYMFVLKETLNFAQSEVADRLREASSECGVESVFRVLPKFSEVGFQEVAGAYMRGAFAGKWGDLRDECRSAVLQSQIRQLLQWTPSARRAV